MSSIESGHRALSVKELALKELGQREAAAPPPYGYDEFRWRHERSVARRRTTGWAAAASVAALGVIIGVALRNSPPPAGMTDAVVAALATDEDSGGVSEPVLVNVGHLALREELQGRIAWFDAALSVGHADELPAADRVQLQRARDEMARSLQHVTYAHALLDF